MKLRWVAILASGSLGVVCVWQAVTGVPLTTMTTFLVGVVLISGSVARALED